MVSFELRVQNLSCEACAKVLQRVLRRAGNASLEWVSGDAKSIRVSCDEKQVEHVKRVLREYKYLDESSGAGAFWHVVKGVFHGLPAFRAEHVLVTRCIVLFGVLFVFLAVAQNVVLARFAGEKLWPVLVLIPFGISLNVGALWHARLLQNYCACNTGMMLGMTIGMMSGFMLGAILGATNGMFVGSVAGMLVGMFLGAYAAGFAGIMGIMEGMLAGLMAGVMGAMLSVMMVTDHLVLFLYVLFFLCALILAGLSYLVYKEAGPLLESSVPGWSELIVQGLIVLVFVVGLAVFGPKSPIAWGLL
ncbi:MAG: hypothetical protein HY393_04485 [Candidatus Diapherotrites archaeon]|nr:hypothetical protein [Candidatus Diapherotrites archaeon]